MVHVKALPGTPRYAGSLEEVVSSSCAEAQLLVKGGVDGLLVENMHDIPYSQGVELGPEVTSSMTRVCSEIRKLTPLPCGVQVLAGANNIAIAVAKAAGFQYIRAEGFVFSHVADEGLMNACAGPLLRYRRMIGADDVMIFTDIKKKHSSHAITQDMTVVSTARAAQFFMSDGVILTGEATGHPVDTSHLIDVLKAVDVPVLIGSGVDAENVSSYINAHGLIVGSSLKVDNRWENPVDYDKVRQLMKKVRELRSNC